MRFSENPKNRLILIMILLVLVGFGIAQIYYKKQNKFVDPRVVKARELYSKYDTFAQENNFSRIFSLLDSIDSIYRKIPHYRQSYEVGVLYNNRSAAYLTMALHFADSSLSLDGVNIVSKDLLFTLGQEYALKSIEVYNTWLDSYAGLNEAEMKQKIAHNYFINMPEVREQDKNQLLTKRLDEMQKAQYETPRRLSVAYTNLGIVERHRDNYTGAIELYTKALELWDRNLTAKNNINVLLGRPMEKPQLIHKFFPPDKEK